MKLITYYGKLEPKSLFRVIVDGDRVQGYVSTPATPRWKKSGAVVSEVEFLSGHEALPISSKEALLVLNAWGGAFDALDDTTPEHEPVNNYEAEMFEEFGEDLLLAPLEVEDVEVVTIDEPQPVAMQSTPPPAPDPVWTTEVDSVMDSFDLWEPPAPVFEPAGQPHYATSEHLSAIEEHLLDVPVAPPPPAPPAEPLTVHFDAVEEEVVEAPQVSQASERDVKLNRLDAYSALRDLADGLSSLGRPGVGWA
ncbi:MAG TPA: hypothetical protein VNC78_06520 [Actinomycetota bacterium]|nr:hypothetical protein [Actinomycetota bacterium]